MQSPSRLSAASIAALTLGLLAPATAFGAAKHKEVRLSFWGAIYTQSDSKSKWENETEAQAGGATTETEESKDEKDWGFNSSLPILGLTTYSDGLVVGGRVFGLIGFLGGDLFVGYETSRTFEVGAYTFINYSGSKTETKTEVSGVEAENETHDSTRNFAIGPYVRATTGPMEFTGILTYDRDAEDDSSRVEEKTGIRLQANATYLVPLNKKISYFSELGISLYKAQDGERETKGATAKTEGELKKEDVTSLSLTLLGLRMSL